MKLKIVLTFIIYLLILNNSKAQTISDSSQKIQISKDLLNITKDSTNINEDTLRIPTTDYYYGNRQRYSLTGNAPYKDTQIGKSNLILVGSIFSALFVGQHVWQEETIWKNKASFKIKEDAIYSLYADKGGHFFGGYIMSYTFNETLLAVGFGKDDGILWGSILGLAYQTYVEVLDGYGQNFGFSPSDFYADVVGSAYYYAQQKIPVLQNFTPKFHYYPAEWHGEHSRKPHDSFIDDYSSQTFYVSINVHNLLPDNYSKYWPEWLELTVGYAARNLSINDPYYQHITPYPGSYPYKSNYAEAWGNPKYIVGLDYDVVKLLPDGCNAWNWFKQSLNYWKLPSPAIEFSRDKPKFFLMYPFQIKF